MCVVLSLSPPVLFIPHSVSVFFVPNFTPPHHTHTSVRGELEPSTVTLHQDHSPSQLLQQSKRRVLQWQNIQENVPPPLAYEHAIGRTDKLVKTPHRESL
ncbi:hypothetical protein, unlikely [Trypanosoma brucei gambiense DAL972]|uniref:Uncharacterized protein n=1 Tax=Trypanosoma brucei gambiense (strain MHOM/CI/86/DAL972) TaxID=679716 RepID=D0A035_TRYB9|nr:hypothetical protein, unlikely [Trypanosoma brucei gambiense DAL972]CBH16593.1 hypothetical protein, unlikely [Trypanosoma brucei gambiense DAL972]|eukprot:XP_011778857.1 hypothetical protein, unlikely [Trypanosoma brucei gambiense DAL972]